MSSSQSEMEAVVGRAIEAAKRAGASQVDVLLVEGNDREVRVRGDEIEFVKQAQERGLGIRALVDGKEGRQTSIVSTSDLAPDAVDRMAEEAVALARATAADPTAGLPEGGLLVMDIAICGCFFPQLYGCFQCSALWDFLQNKLLPWRWISGRHHAPTIP